MIQGSPLPYTQHMSKTRAVKLKLSQDDLDNVQQLVDALKNEQNAGAEMKMRGFLVRCGKAYDFSAYPILRDLMELLLQRRLLAPQWTETSRLHKLCVLQVLRILTRDANLQGIFMRNNPMAALALEMDSLSTEIFKEDAGTEPEVTQGLIELMSIMRRFSSNLAWQDQIFKFGVHKTMVLLLSCGDLLITQAVLICLLRLASHPAFPQKVPKLPCVDPLLQLLQEPSSNRIFAVDLLAALFHNQQSRADVKLYQGIGTLLQLATSSPIDLDTVLSVLRCLSNLAMFDAQARREICLRGGIPLILGLLNGAPNIRVPPARRDRPRPPTALSSRGASFSTSIKSPPGVLARVPADTAGDGGANLAIAVCRVLAQMCLDDDNAGQIKKLNGIYRIGTLLLRTPVLQAALRGADDGKAAPLGRAYSVPSAQVQTYAFRTLRFLFSVEKNRKVFKRLFPPGLLSLFIDVGHYVMDLNAYRPLVKFLNALGVGERKQILSSFEELNNFMKGGAKGKRVINGYVVLDVLGRGAFGTVYQVKKESGSQHYAMKEIPLDCESKQSTSEMCREVEIIRTLEHPNIVAYLTSFVEADSLYIVMELVEGQSLLHYLNSLAKKGQLMTEVKIWPIFIQICQAVYYMHNEKFVTHRDLTPSNVMLNHTLKVKITDFGLAHKRSAGSLMKSFVGTICYSCPEIVQHQSYTEKADIWTLGCVLYQMATLRPPFSGSNPLTVAQKIVEGKFDPIGDRYSTLLIQVVNRCLSTDPAKRPNISEVSRLISSLLMVQLDRVSMTLQRVENELEHQKQARRHETDEFIRTKQLVYHQQLASPYRLRRGSATSPISKGAPPHHHGLKPQAQARPAHRGSGLAGPNTGAAAGGANAGASSPTRGDRRGSFGERRGSLGAGSGSARMRDRKPPSPGQGAAASFRRPALSIDPSSFPRIGGSPGLRGIGIGSPTSPNSSRVRATLSVPSARLMPITDPNDQILDQLHKIVYISQLAPTLERDTDRTFVCWYKRRLFSADHPNIKQEMKKLINASSQHVDVGRAPTPNDPASGRDGAMRITYNQLNFMIEKILNSVGYDEMGFRGGKHGGSSGPARSPARSSSARTNQGSPPLPPLSSPKMRGVPVNFDTLPMMGTGVVAGNGKGSAAPAEASKRRSPLSRNDRGRKSPVSLRSASKVLQHE